MSLRLGAVLLLLLCAGCSKALRDVGPTIKDLERRRTPPADELTIQSSELVDADPVLALDNYRRILDLTPDAETRAEAMRRLADLQVELDDMDPGQDSERALSESVHLYRTLLQERPQDERNDRVLYQLARALQNQGDSTGAVDALDRLSREFPDSALAADGRFRRAEMLFRMDRYREAADEYAFVMDLRDATPFYEAAQYKYGWALYRQSRYDDALEVFFTILERELPGGEPVDPETALDAVGTGKREMARDVLRVTNLSFAAMGGGPAVNDTLSRRGQPRFYALLYNALADHLLERQRYTDAAEAAGAFVQRFARHPMAPHFQSRVIVAYQNGGFSDLVLREKERYADAYDPRAPYWGGGPASEAVLTELRGHIDDLARYYHARAAADREAHTGDFLVAAGWYRRFLDIYADDERAPEIRFLLAESLYDGGEILPAAREYTAAAYDYPSHPRSAEAGYAAVLAYQQHAGDARPAQRSDTLRQAVDSGLRFADAFDAHPRVSAVLTRAAEDLFELKEYAEAVQVAARVLASPTLDPPLRRTALEVTADAEFTQSNWSQAERAYASLLAALPAADDQRGRVNEQLAASIYKQAEAARDAGDLRAAVVDFLRVGRVTPAATVRANADYDAASALLQLEDWLGATEVLEGFRTRFPQHDLIPDADKRLAAAYERGGHPRHAAAAYARIAERSTEPADVRRDAAWSAATLYDEAGDLTAAATAYETYVRAWPRPLDDATTARERLIALWRGRDDARWRQWLSDAVTADANAGAARSDRSQLLAARASLELGRLAARDAERARITLPLQRSLPARRSAVEAAVRTLTRAAGYGFAEVTTAATYELGVLYQDFGRALLDSDRPRNLNELEREQYELLLEEQAFPFEERAIEWHENNLRRIRQGAFDQWVRRSYGALERLVPARYAKQEQTEAFYDSLR